MAFAMSPVEEYAQKVTKIFSKKNLSQRLMKKTCTITNKREYKEVPTTQCLSNVKIT